MGDFVNVFIGAPDGQTAVSLSSADKIHVSIAAGFTSSGSGGSGSTNLSTTRTATTVTVVSDSGTDATIPAADGTNAGVMTAAMQTKLAGIETGAEVNDSAAEILAKVVTVDGTGSGLDADLLDGNHASAFAAAVHTHAIGDVSGLQTALDGKVDENAAITGATKTKITYDAKGLVTAGADATTADIADSLNKRYVTDADLTKLANTSGTNTGDQNLFSTIAVSGQSNVVADTTGDTLTLVAGSNVTITTDASTDSITISASGGGGGISDGDKGDITVSSSGTVWTIDNDAVTYAKIQNVSNTNRILGRSTAGAGDIEEITVGGDLTQSGSSFTIGNNAVTLAKIQDITTARILGRVTAGSGDPEELTGTQATTLLDTFTSSLKGLAPASGGGTSNFLRADGTWAAPAGGGGGDLTVLAQSATNTGPSNTTTETAIFSHSLASLDAGETLILEIIGQILNNTGNNADVTLRIKLGTTTIISNANVLTNTFSSANQWFVLRVQLYAVSNAAQRCNYVGFQATAADGNASQWTVTNRALSSGGYGTATEDTTSAKTFQATIQLGSANANLSATARAAVLYKLSAP